MNFERIYHIVWGIFLVVFLSLEHWTTMALLLVILTTIVGIVLKELHWKPHKLLWLFPALYIAYAIGVFFSDDLAHASRYFEYKLSFVIFPLLFAFRLRDASLSLRKILPFFLGGLVLSSLLGIIPALGCYRETGQMSCLFSSALSPIHHPTYLSAFLFMGMICLFSAQRRGWKGYRWGWTIPLMLFFTICQLFLISLAGVLLLVLTILIYGGFVFYRRFGKWKSILVSALLTAACLSVFAIPKIRHDLGGTVYYLRDYLHDPLHFVRSRTPPVSGSETRLCLWTASVELIGEHPLGVGTDNLDPVMHTKLTELGQPGMADHYYNPHNQYFQTAIEIGLPGMFLLLLLVFAYFCYGVKVRSWLMTLLTVNLAFNMLFESMLQRQSGIVFYTFFLCFLLIRFEQQKQRTAIS